MSRKRKIEIEIEQQEEQEQEEEEKESKNRKNKQKKISTTLKEKILTILSNSETLIGLQKIKKILINEYNLNNTKLLNTNVNKTLKLLVEENDIENFGKIGGSYHGGIRSKAYLSYQKEQEKKQEINEHRNNGDVLCPYCNLWCDGDCFVREDSVARGGLYVCEHCSEDFWTWISDGYLYGHKVEYRYGDGRDDYAHLNRRRK